ncbi:ureidoglycolate lyase [Achromobacter aloeverae]
MKNLLKLDVLTREAFAPYGDVIECREGEFHHINNGMVERYHDLASVQAGAPEGRIGISLMRATPYRLPHEVDFLERHPLSSQAFMPTSATRFIIVVAPRGPTVALADVRGFISQPGQGVNYAPGVWHHVLFATEACDFIVVDRVGGGPNCDKFNFDAGDRPVIADAPFVH